MFDGFCELMTQAANVICYHLCDWRGTMWHKSFKKRGIGRSLIEEGIRRCRELNYGVILLIGHPAYYPKFGWKPARQHGLELTQFPVSDDVFMANEIIPGKLAKVKGELRYPKAFLD